MMFLIHLLITVYLLTLSNFVSSASFGSSVKKALQLENDGKPLKPENDGKALKPENDGKPLKSENDGKALKPENDGIPLKSENDGKALKPENFLDELRNVVDQIAHSDKDIMALPKEEHWRIHTELSHYDSNSIFAKRKITDPQTKEVMYTGEYISHPRTLYAKTWLVKRPLRLNEIPDWLNAIAKRFSPHKFHATYRIVIYERLNSLLSSSNPGDVVVIDSFGRCFPMQKDAASGEFTVKDDVYFSLPTVRAETLRNLIRQTRENVKTNGRIYPIVYADNNVLRLMIVDGNLTLLEEAPICSVERSRYYPPGKKPTQRGALKRVTEVAKVYDDGLDHE